MNDKTGYGNRRTAPKLTAAETEALFAWLVARQAAPARMTIHIDSYCRKLRALGVPLDRATLVIPQLNPRLRSRSFYWDSEAGGTMEVGRRHGIEQAELYLLSPIRAIFEGAEPIRRRLADPNCPTDYPIVADLKGRGYTDYLACPMAFSDRQINVVTLATKDPDGFLEQHLRLIEASLPALSLVIELRNRRTTAEELLDTYIGHQSGEKVLAGTIKRGEGEVIHAVLWACDLQDFTGLSEREALDEVIALLNDYFEAVGGAISAQGGEILKFIGDALLAIFPLPEASAGYQQACDNALKAAKTALRSLAELNAARQAEQRPTVTCGIALHIGDVMFGNIGTADRLDFTVIGPAVNLVSRIEALAREFDPPIVCTAAFAAQASFPLESLGRRGFKGIAEPQEVFRLAGACAAGAAKNAALEGSDP